MGQQRAGVARTEQAKSTVMEPGGERRSGRQGTDGAEAVGETEHNRRQSMMGGGIMRSKACWEMEQDGKCGTMGNGA